MKIEPHSLESFFATVPLFSETSLGFNCVDQVASFQVHVPLFQRRYCWLPKQVNTIWKDVSENYSMLNGHHIGKLYFQKRKDKIFCVDGQQRLTTLTIMLSCFRDVAIELMQQKELDEKRRRILTILIGKLHSYLFVNCEKLSSEPFEFLKQPHQNDQSIKEWCNTMKTIARFVPSHDDRMAYFCILTNTNTDEITEQTSVNPWMVLAHRIMLTNIRSYLMHHTNQIEQLNSLVKRTMSCVRFVILEFKEEEKNVHQTYKELFDTGKANQFIFFIKAPGIDLANSDLIKNYILTFYAESEELQEEIYEKFWLPLERCFDKKINTCQDEMPKKKKNSLERGEFHVQELQSRDLDCFFDWFLNFRGKSREQIEEMEKEREEERKRYLNMPLAMQMGCCTTNSIFNQFVKYVETVRFHTNPPSKPEVETLLKELIDECKHNYFSFFHE